MTTPDPRGWPALSIQQPWAELLLCGRKSIEIRSWATDYRGRFWLQVSSKPQPVLEERFGLAHPYRGGVIGSLQLSAVVPLNPQRWRQWQEAHLDEGPYRDGLLAWIVEAPRRFQSPVTMKGALGFFHPAADCLDALESAEAGASGGDA